MLEMFNLRVRLRYVKVSTAHELGSSYIVSLSEALASVSKLQLSGLPDGAVAEYARSAMIQRLVSVFTRLASCVRTTDPPVYHAASHQSLSMCTDPAH